MAKTLPVSMTKGVYSVINQAAAVFARSPAPAAARPSEPEPRAPAPAVTPVEVPATRGSGQPGSAYSDAERSERIAAQQAAAQQDVMVEHLDYQSKLLKSILDQLRTNGSGGNGNTIDSLLPAVESLAGSVTKPIASVMGHLGNTLRKAGNARMLSGALDGGVKGGLRGLEGRLMAGGGGALAKFAGSKLLSVLEGPVGYGLASAATGAWTAAHESKREMEGKYGKGNDNSGYRVVEGARQGLSDATFGLSEFGINEISKHAPGASKIVDSIAQGLERKIDTVRGIWNPDARKDLKKSYGTDSTTKAMVLGLAGTLTGGISDLLVGKNAPFAQQMDKVTAAVGGFSDSVLGKDGLVDRISDSFTSAFTGFDWSTTGLADLATRSANAVARAVTGDQNTTAAAEGHKLVQRGQAAAQKTHDFASHAAAKTVEVASNIKDWALGKTSQKFESGRSGAGTVSTGAGDAGGASYGTYQMSSSRGVVQDFIKQSDHAKDFAGLQPGSAAFNDKWKQVSASDAKFGDAQHAYIKKTHFDPQHAALQKAGIDLTKRGAAVQDAIWSTSVQMGGNTSVIKDALKGKDTAKMSDADIVKAVQGYKVEHNDQLFKSSSANVRAGTLKREQAEQKDLLALAAADDKAKSTITPGIPDNQRVASDTGFNASAQWIHDHPEEANKIRLKTDPFAGIESGKDPATTTKVADAKPGPKGVAVAAAKPTPAVPYATPAGPNPKDVAVAAAKTVTPDAVRGSDFSSQEVAAASAEIKKNGGSQTNLTPAQRAAVDASARVAANSVPPGHIDPANVAKGYQSNGIDFSGSGFYQPGEARPAASANAQPNPDLQAAARASSAPAAAPAAAPEAPAQTAAATPSSSRSGVPNDISSVGLLLFNTSVFS